MLPQYLKQLNKNVEDLIYINQFFGMASLIEIVFKLHRTFGPRPSNSLSHHEHIFNCQIYPPPYGQQKILLEDEINRLYAKYNLNLVAYHQIGKYLSSRTDDLFTGKNKLRDMLPQTINQDSNFEPGGIILVNDFLTYLLNLNPSFSFDILDKGPWFACDYPGFCFISDKLDWGILYTRLIDFLERTFNQFCLEDEITSDELEFCRSFFTDYKKLIDKIFNDYTLLKSKHCKLNTRFIDHMNRKIVSSDTTARTIKFIFKNFKNILGYINASSLKPSHIQYFDIKEKPIGKLSKKFRKENQLLILLTSYKIRKINDSIKFKNTKTNLLSTKDSKLLLPTGMIQFDKDGKILQSGFLTGSIGGSTHELKMSFLNSSNFESYIAIKLPETENEIDEFKTTYYDFYFPTKQDERDYYNKIELKTKINNRTEKLISKKEAKKIKELYEVFKHVENKFEEKFINQIDNLEKSTSSENLEKIEKLARLSKYQNFSNELIEKYSKAMNEFSTSGLMNKVTRSGLILNLEKQISQLRSQLKCL